MRLTSRLLLLSISGLFASDLSNAKNWSYQHYLGNLSPYHAAPHVSGIKGTLPDTCTIEQVMLMGRHGSRFPTPDKSKKIQTLVVKLESASEAIAKANLPHYLDFLKDGYTSNLATNDLTVPGRAELFMHGVDFRMRYPHLEAKKVLATAVDRAQESAQWFASGYFGREWGYMNATAFSILPHDNVTVSWLIPTQTCSGWRNGKTSNASYIWSNTYLPPIAARLNELLPGVNLTTHDVHGALYACAHDYAAWRESPWCHVFMVHEIEAFEYELDLAMIDTFGYNLRAPMGPLLGSIYVNKLIERYEVYMEHLNNQLSSRFTNSSGDADAVYLEFGHDTTIAFILTALGLAKDDPPLSDSVQNSRQSMQSEQTTFFALEDVHPSNILVNPNRKWKTSQQMPFAAQMVWERFSCDSLSGPQIRLILNDATLPLTMCESSDFDKKYGSCSFGAFVDANNFSTSHPYGDALWKTTCKLS